jgi:hypothetical protein
VNDKTVLGANDAILVSNKVHTPSPPQRGTRALHPSWKALL